MNLSDCMAISLDEVLTSFSKSVQKAIDKQAPEKRVKLFLRKSKPSIMMT